MLSIKQEILDQIFAECERGYPNEACGLLIGFAVEGQRTATQFIACENLQNKLHEKDAARYPRDAKTAYVIDPKEFDRIKKDAELKGEQLISIVHSHPEHGVYFSDEDKEMASPWGEPLFPDLSYMVVSVYDGRVKSASDFYWDNNKNDFVENILT